MYKERKLGHGSYGEVFLNSDGKTASKVVDMTSYDASIHPSVLREIAALEALRHSPYVVKIQSTRFEQYHYEFTMHRYSYDLAYLIRRHHKYLLGKPALIMRIIYAVLRCLYDCQRSMVIHRDIKPANILIDGDHVVVCDWGLARVGFVSDHNHFYSNNVQSIWYRAPEILLGSEHYNNSADLWSLGVVIYEMYHGAPLIRTQWQVEMLMGLFRIFGTPTRVTWPWCQSLANYSQLFPKFTQASVSPFANMADKNCSDLLDKILVLNPDARITCENALKHPYFSDIHSALPQIGRRFLPNLYPVQAVTIDTGRENAFNYLCEIVDNAQSDVVVFTAIRYYDIYKSHETGDTIRNTWDIWKNRDLCIVFVCLVIASKIYSKAPVSPLNYIHELGMTSALYNQLELMVIRLLWSHLYQVTEAHYLSIFQQDPELKGLTHEVHGQSMRLLYLFMSEKTHRHYHPYELVVSILHYFQVLDAGQYIDEQKLDRVLGDIQHVSRLECSRHLTGLLTRRKHV